MSQQLDVLMVTFAGCDRGQINDAAAVESLLQAAVARAGFSLLDIRTCTFEPQGVTGVAIVGESHLAIHTWPETGALFFEVVSCAGKQMTRDAMAAIEEGLVGATAENVQELVQPVDGSG